MPVFEPRRPTNRKLFDVPEGSTRSFVLGSWSPDWHLWVAGYKLAADRLVSHLTEHGTRFDYVCIPILFLYRHFVELYLKALLRDVGELLETSEAVQFSHPLLPLWKKLRARLVSFDPRNDSAWNDRAESLIAEMDSLDASSFTFRYPENKAGAVTIPALKIDMFHFKDVLAELEFVLTAADGYVSEYLDLQRDHDDEVIDAPLYFT